MNKILSILVACALALSVFLMGVSCTKTKGEKGPEGIKDGTTDVQYADSQGTSKDPEDTKKDDEIGDKTPSDTTVKSEAQDTSKDTSKVDKDKDTKDTSKADKDKDTKDTASSDKGSKDTEKAPQGSSQSGKDTEKADDKETAYQPEPMTYKEFISMSAYDQQAYYEQFDNIEDYLNWYNNALKEYEKEQNKQEIDGVIDIGDLINGGGN